MNKKGATAFGYILLLIAVTLTVIGSIFLVRDKVDNTTNNTVITVETENDCMLQRKEWDAVNKTCVYKSEPSKPSSPDSPSESDKEATLQLTNGNIVAYTTELGVGRLSSFEIDLSSININLLPYEFSNLTIKQNGVDVTNNFDIPFTFPDIYWIDHEDMYGFINCKSYSATGNLSAFNTQYGSTISLSLKSGANITISNGDVWTISLEEIAILNSPYGNPFNDYKYLLQMKFGSFSNLVFGSTSLLSSDIEYIDLSSTGKQIKGTVIDGTAYVLCDETIYINKEVENLFKGLTSVSGLNKLDVSYVVKGTNLFYGFKGNKLDASALNFTSIKDASNMFMESKCEEIILPNISPSVNNLSQMFNISTNLNKISGLENLDTSNVSNMSNMFNGCKGLISIDISNFNTSNVTNMSYMFAANPNLTNIYIGDNWTTSNVTNSTGMFYKSSNLPNFNSSYEDKTYAYFDCLGTGYLSSHHLCVD